MRQNNDLPPLLAFDVVEKGGDAGAEVLRAFTAWRRERQRIPRPGVEKVAVDFTPWLQFPIAEIHFPQAVVETRRRTEGLGQQAAPAQGTGEKRGVRGKQAAQTVRLLFGGPRQADIRTAMTQSGGHSGPGMADQEKAPHVAPR